MGVARLINATKNKLLEDEVKTMEYISGILALIIGLFIIIIVFINSSISINMLISLLSIVLLFIGIARTIRGIQVKGFPSWFRILDSIVGILTIVLSAMIFIFPSFSYSILIFILTIALLFNGITRIAFGLTMSN